MNIISKSIKAGIFMFVCITAWFFVMKLFGWEQIQGLRFVNVIFAVLFTNMVAKSNAHEVEDIGYVRNFGMLLMVNIVAVALSVIGFYIYTNFLDPASLEEIEKGFFWGNNLSPLEISAALLLEGAAGGLIISFTLMQYWKDRRKKIHHNNSVNS